MREQTYTVGHGVKVELDGTDISNNLCSIEMSIGPARVTEIVLKFAGASASEDIERELGRLVRLRG